jgi:nucleoside-diphosphate-sugar epimerase
MNVLITGGLGFVARHITAELEKHHHQIRLLDRVDPQDATIFVPGSSGRKHIPLKTNWPFIRAEITDLDAMCRACEGIDAVIHLAAATTGLPEHGKMIMDANVTGTYVMLDAARRQKAKRFICASSINAFGTIYWRLSGKPVEYTRMPLDENFPPVPEDPYSLSKHFNEQTCAAFNRAYGIITAALRFSGVWTDEMYQNARQNLKPTTAWSDELFTWVHVNDIASGVRAALEAETLPGHGVYTLAAPDTRCPEPTMELLRKLRPDLARTVIEPIPGRETLISIKRAQQTLGYAPRYSLT